MLKTILNELKAFESMLDEIMSSDEEESKLEVANENYHRPQTKEEIYTQYGEFVGNQILSDPVKKYRAVSGIEVVYNTGAVESQIENWRNWNAMTTIQKEESDRKSMELFGMDNAQHYKELCIYQYPGLIATEADTVTTQTSNSESDNSRVTQNSLPQDDGAKSNTQSVDKADAISGEEKAKAFSNMLTEIIDKFGLAIEEVFNSLFNKFALLTESDEGFIKNYNEARKNYKPMNKRTFTLYDYHSQKLNTYRALFNQIEKEALSQVLSVKAGEKLPEGCLIDQKETDFLPTLLHKLHAPAGVNNFDGFLTLVTNDFRGEKKDKVIAPDQLRKYEIIALGRTGQLKNQLNADKNEVFSTTNQIKQMMQRVANNSALSDNIRSRVKRNIKHLIRLEKIYNSFLETYYNLKIEEILQARTILGRMYKF